MDIRFHCTQCGKCCHGLRLTLSVAEALRWAGNGHDVQVLTEAFPGADGTDTGLSPFDIGRSFPARSGGVPFRIAATLVAWHEGACPHLLPDMRCGNYANRPRICRIYPLQRRPATPLVPAQRLCPPEAWSADHPLIVANGEVADPADASVMADHRHEAIEDVAVLGGLCGELAITTAAFANEGLAVHPFDPRVLAAALRRAIASSQPVDGAGEWTIVTNRGRTLQMLADAGCRARLVARGLTYLGSFADEP